MSLLYGLIALALVGAEGSPAPESGAIKAQIRVLEMDGLAWRDGVQGKLQLISKQGSATVWTAGKDVVASLVDTADRVVAAPRVASVQNQQTTVLMKTARHYVAQLGRIANGPRNEATAVAYNPDIQRLDDGIEARIAYRSMDQGVLARVKLEDTWFIAFHTVTCTETVTPDEEGKAKGHHGAAIASQYQVPEVATSLVDGEWLIPTDGALIISLGARTVPGKSTVFGTPARVRERIAVIEAQSAPRSASLKQPAQPEPVTFANQPIPPGTPHPIATAPLGSPSAAWAVMPAPSGGSMSHVDARAFVWGSPPVPLPIAVPLRSYYLDHGVRVVEHPTMAPRQAPVGRSLIGIGANTFGGLSGDIVPPPPIPYQAGCCDSQIAAVRATAPTDRQVVSTSRPANVPASQTYAALVATRPRANVGTGRAVPDTELLPTLPSRNLPQPFDASGAPVSLPPLPDETADALAMAERQNDTDETRPSPQFHAPTSPEPTTLAFGDTGTVELKGRVTIRTENGMVIEADSVILKPPTRTIQAIGDVSVMPTAAPAASPIPTHPAEPAACSAPTSETIPTMDSCPKPCCAIEPCPVVPTGCPACPAQLSQVRFSISEILSEVFDLTPATVVERLCTSKGIDPATGECQTVVFPYHPAKLAAILTSIPDLGGSVCVASSIAGVNHGSPTDPAVMAAGYSEDGETSHERAYRIPVGRGAIELKIRVGRVTRPVTADN